MAEMGEISTPIDISDSVTAAREHVKCPKLIDALFRFAIGHPLLDPKKIREEVIESAKKVSSQPSFGGIVGGGSKGRVTANKASPMGLQGKEAEAAMEDEMFAHAQLHWSLRVSCYIDPARLQIRNDHHPTFHDLAFIVRNNPFVPPGHEGIFLRGIHAGFHSDFLIASHLLSSAN